MGAEPDELSQHILKIAGTLHLHVPGLQMGLDGLGDHLVVLHQKNPIHPSHLSTISPGTPLPGSQGAAGSGAAALFSLGNGRERCRVPAHGAQAFFAYWLMYLSTLPSPSEEGSFSMASMSSPRSL